MRSFLVLLLAVVMALTLTACSGDEENGGAEPGNLEEETGDSGKEPVITKGEWYFVDGEFHKFTDLSFIAYFKEFEITLYDDFFSETCYLHSKYLGDDTVHDTKTGHFAITVSKEEDGQKTLEGYVELWYTETGELMQMAMPGAKEGEMVIENYPYTINDRAEDIVDDFNLDIFFMYHGLFDEEHGKGYDAYFNDPEFYANKVADGAYVINEISSQKRDFGAGKVTVIHYDYAFTDSSYSFINDIAKIGDKYMFVYIYDKMEDIIEYTVTRAVPLK